MSIVESLFLFCSRGFWQAANESIKPSTITNTVCKEAVLLFLIFEDEKDSRPYCDGFFVEHRMNVISQFTLRVILLEGVTARPHSVAVLFPIRLLSPCEHDCN